MAQLMVQAFGRYGFDARQEYFGERWHNNTRSRRNGNGDQDEHEGTEIVDVRFQSEVAACSIPQEPTPVDLGIERLIPPHIWQLPHVRRIEKKRLWLQRAPEREEIERDWMDDNDSNVFSLRREPEREYVERYWMGLHDISV